MTVRGALIVLEGLDRTGKSTQAKLLVQNLNNKGVPAELQTFPDRTTPTGEAIAKYLRNALDLSDQEIHRLFSKNRWEKKEAMLAKLQSGVSLVVDRYAYSGVAFSSAKPGLSIDWCRSHDIGLPKPDVVFFLSADPEALEERGGYGDERYEKKEFQKVVAARYSELEDPSWVKVDAARTTDEIAKQLLTIVEERMQSLPGTIGELWKDEIDAKE